MEYGAVIGLEVHALLLSLSKIFCGCSTTFGAPPNTQTCPVFLGMPGVLPVLNKKVVDYALKMALAISCTVAPESVFARKNYFYPDLPKGYQISQYELPLAEHGYLDIAVNGRKKRIGITRIHLEEDAGKLIHSDTRPVSFVDLNRTGVPLIEIVSEPDMGEPEEAVEYLKGLRNILLYLEICDGNMEEGSLRCDANISLRPAGATEFGTKTELKNINSFRFVRQALEYEIRRQRAITKGSVAVTENNHNATEDMVAKVLIESMQKYCPELTVLPVELEGPEPTKAIAVATSIIQANPDIVAGFSTTGGGPTTWAGAQKETGKNILAVGMDYTRQNLDLVKNGEVWGIVAQPIYDEMSGAAELVYKMANGEKVPYWTVLEAPLVTKDNVDDYYGILDRLEPNYRYAAA